MIRDDANRFQQELEEKKMKKRITQGDYRSFLDRQVEHVRAQNELQEREAMDDAQLIQSKIRRMGEIEAQKRLAEQVKAKAVSDENSHLNMQ
jgi:hypothetical protein